MRNLIILNTATSIAEIAYRIIILYAISAIEAILLYLYKINNKPQKTKEYIHINQLPTKYIYTETPNDKVVIAVQKIRNKNDREMTFSALVQYWADEKILNKETSTEILELNSMRNTFHFSKKRDKDCTVQLVEQGFKLLNKVLEKGPVITKKIKTTI